MAATESSSINIETIPENKCDSKFSLKNIHEKALSTGGSIQGFLNALSVYINKPHVVNRRLVGSKLIFIENDTNILKTHETSDKFISRFNNNKNANDGQEQEKLTSFNQALVDVKLTDDKSSWLLIRDLIPKQIDKYPTLREIIQYDSDNKTIKFTPLCRINTVDGKHIYDKQIEEELTYSFTYHPNDQSSKISLKVFKKEDVVGDGHVTLTWLTDILLVKICRWAEEESLRTNQTSLCLVDVEEYNQLYNHLKQKYGLKLVEVWPERTDPQKFVYEDIAIATYLLLLWKKDCELKGLKVKQSFVDLGCGNGLLVYILTLEGHKGLGLDLRKRQIWDWYGSDFNLKVESITPSEETVFPDYDWLIGNHSDELTPWIPVMTARSSYTCNYFVLPCCHHDFNSKFNHRQVGMSQYQTYLQFVKQVGEVCGFHVEEDTLRIPSTKRVCFIGRSRNFSQSEEKAIDENISSYIKKRCSKADNSQTLVYDCDNTEAGANKKCKMDLNCVKTSQWTNNFTPRTDIEIPRNCQSVATETKETIVTAVFEKILSLEDCTVVKTKHGTDWNRGGKLPLGQVAQLFSDSILQELKSECGGLQTLLRNHTHIFQVSGGVVQLRDLSSDDPWGRNTAKKKKISRTNAEDYIKTTLCWFHAKHPNGCPQLTENCKYAHGQNELRPKPAKNKTYTVTRNDKIQ